MLKADGFDEAFLGVASRFNMEDVFAYDMDECIAILCRRDNMSYEDAIEFFHYNVLGAWVGKKTPLFLKKYGSIKDAENALYL
jgi:hypothetical protein|tara:strand:+ start:561 stop:809 length:249 start_codon:yes stop_codon:yes gene_type:complete